MGYYIPGPTFGKANYILNEYGATELQGPAAARHAFDEGMGVICVVENGFFDAAAFAFSQEKLNAFIGQGTNDLRPKRWLAMDVKKAIELSDCPPKNYRPRE